MKIFFTSLIFLLSIACYSQKNYSGIYKTNFPRDGIYTNILTLNCDNFMTFEIIGDTIQYNNYGKWATNNEGITIIFDSINYPNQKYKGKRNFKLKNDRLYLINTFTKEQYNKIISESKEKDSKATYSTYRFIKKALQLMPINKNGDKDVQFYQQIKVFYCDKR